MNSSNAWDFLVARDNFRRTTFHLEPGLPDRRLEVGEVLLGVERFALSANNMTYAATGDEFGYWDLFEAPPGWGRIPAWGYARVIASACAQVRVGERVFGLVPMSSHFVMRPHRNSGGLVDQSAGRSRLNPAYNFYADCGSVLGDQDEYEAIFRPLLITSMIFADFLQANEAFSAQRVVISSASSKTAMGLAHMLGGSGLVRVGLTSRRNRDFVTNLGLFEQVVAYDDMDLEPGCPTVLADFTGDMAIVASVHEALSADLRHSALIGFTHEKARAQASRLPGVEPEFFFAPDHIRRRMTEWGPPEFAHRLNAAITSFAPVAAPWFALSRGLGPRALDVAYGRLAQGGIDPREGLIIQVTG